MAIFNKQVFNLCLLALLSNFSSHSDAGTAEDVPNRDDHQQSLLDAYYKLPLVFEHNDGQFDQQVSYFSRGAGYGLFLTPTEVVLTLKYEQPQKENGSEYESILKMSLSGSNKSPRILGKNLLHSKSNYFIGKNPDHWRTGVDQYGQVRYESVYPGIDIIYYGKQRSLEYDFVVAPGADPDVIRLGLSGIRDINIDNACNLILDLPGGQLVQHAPIIYQIIEGKKITVQGCYTLISDKTQSDEAAYVGFHLASYDRANELVIDPVISYATFLGGNNKDIGHAVALDSSGRIHIAGETSSSAFPIQSAIDGTQGGQVDAFVMRFNINPALGLDYSTYIGGAAIDKALGIAIDNSGNVYMAGSTNSSDFTVVNPLQPSLAGNTDTFIVKLNPFGNALVYSTYFGGSATDSARSIAVNTSGNAFITGQTASSFSTVNAAQTTRPGLIAAFVARLNVMGNNFDFLTYLGGTGTEDSNGITIDTSGNIYVTGETDSSNFPVSNAVQASKGGGKDVFVTKYNGVSGAVMYSTYLGGVGMDIGKAITVDETGNIYVTGSTSGSFPVINAFQSLFGGGARDAFITMINSSAQLGYSTYLGGSRDDDGSAIDTDDNGNVYVTGTTSSDDGTNNFPTINAPYASYQGGNSDAFVTKINAAGTDLLYSTYLGGSVITSGDRGLGIAVSGTGIAYIAGTTGANDFPVTADAYDTTINDIVLDGTDVFVVKLEILPGDLSIDSVDSPDPVTVGNNITYTLTVTNGGSDLATGVTVLDMLDSSVTYVSASPGQGVCNESSGTVACSLGSITAGTSVQIVIIVTANSAGTVSNTANVSANEADPDSSNNSKLQQTTIQSVGGSGGSGGGGGYVDILFLQFLCLLVFCVKSYRARLLDKIS